MDKIIDFKCVINEAVGLSKEESKELNITYPEVHYDKEMLVKAAKAIKNKIDSPFCELPFCHTLEAENLGGNINYGNEINGPRAADYIMTSFDELLNLPSFDFEKGRMKLVLDGIKELNYDNEIVLLNVSGPFTLLNTLIDPKYIFKAMRKEPEQTWKVFDKMQVELLRYLEVAKNNGVKLISFADPLGGVEILGPKLMISYLDNFVIPFIKKALDICDNEMILVLCPKLTYALTSNNKAHFDDIQLDDKLSYAQAMTSLIDENIIVGEMCIQNKNTILNTEKIKSIVLD